MRIAINTRFLLKDKLEGFGWYTYEIAKRLVENHPEHTFYFFFDRAYDSRFIFADNVIPIVLNPPARHPILFKIWFNYSVTKALKKYKIEVFFSPDGYLSLKTKVPQVATIHDINFEHFPLDIPSSPRKYLRKYFPLFAKKASKIITVSQFSKNDIIKTYGIDEAKIKCIYNGVSETYNPIKDKQLIRDEYSQGKNYFVFVGSLHPRKNLGRLIEAFRIYSKNGGILDLLIVGCKMWSEPKFNLDDEHKKRIHFTDYLDQKDLVRVLGSADILVYVPYFEGFGLPLVEAMKVEIPIISGNLTSLPEIAGEAALYCNPMDVEDIASKMLLLAKDETLQKELIEKGKQQLRKFSWDAAAELVWEEIVGVI